MFQWLLIQGTSFCLHKGLGGTLTTPGSPRTGLGNALQTVGLCIIYFMYLLYVLGKLHVDMHIYTVDSHVQTHDTGTAPNKGF